MIHVVIDTNKLPRNVSSPSAAFKRTVKLIQEGVIKVLMPYVIAEEWRTQQLEHLRKQFQKAGEALKDVLDGGHLEGHGEWGALIAAAAAIERTAAGIEAISHQALEGLLQQLQTQVIPIANEHGPRVMAAYFKGSSPFAGVKSRKDFPDAFVHQAVADLTGPDPTDRVVVVITADGNLAKHLSLLSGVTRVETLEKLVESTRVKELTAEIALEAKWRDELPTVLTAIKEHERDVLAKGFVNSFIGKLVCHDVEHPWIDDAIVSMVDDPKEIEIDWDEAEDYGPGVLRVPFSCTSEVLLESYIFCADAYSQPDEEKAFFDARNAIAEVKGFMSVTFNEWPGNMDPESIEVTVDKITEVELNVELNEDDVGNALS